MTKTGTLAIMIGIMSVFAATPSSARLLCNGPYQIVDGTEISTPFCGDHYLARIAREYGMRVSSRAVRWNPSVKEEACQLVGHDNRVSDICAGLRNQYFGDRGGRRG